MATVNTRYPKSCKNENFSHPANNDTTHTTTILKVHTRHRLNAETYFVILIPK